MALCGWLPQHEDAIFQAGIDTLRKALEDFPEALSCSSEDALAQNTGPTQMDPVSFDVNLPSLATLLADLGPFDVRLLLAEQIATRHWRILATLPWTRHTHHGFERLLGLPGCWLLGGCGRNRHARRGLPFSPTSRPPPGV